MPVRALSFDLFDTLVDLYMEKLPPATVRGRAVRSTLPALHAVVAERADVDLEEFAETLGCVDRELRETLAAQGRELPTLERFRAVVERLGVDDPELAEVLTLTHMEKIRELVRPLPHHAGLLAELAGRYRLAVCSNFSHTPTALRIVQEAGLRPYLDAVVISEEVGFRKPGAPIFRATLGRLGAAAEETVHVGDQLVADVQGAAELGMRAVWLTRRVADAEADLREHGGPAPSAIIADLGELPALLDGG